MNGAMMKRTENGYKERLTDFRYAIPGDPIRELCISPTIQQQLSDFSVSFITSIRQRSLFDWFGGGWEMVDCYLLETINKLSRGHNSIILRHGPDLQSMPLPIRN